MLFFLSISQFYTYQVLLEGKTYHLSSLKEQKSKKSNLGIYRKSTWKSRLDHTTITQDFIVKAMLKNYDIPMRYRYGSLTSKETMTQKWNTTEFRIPELKLQVRLKEEIKQRKYIHIR